MVDVFVSDSRLFVILKIFSLKRDFSKRACMLHVGWSTDNPETEVYSHAGNEDLSAKSV